MNTLFVILGPTGVGKTDLSLRLAQELQTPIISGDSRQIYRGLEIGTAAPAEKELKAVKHYFVGTHDVAEYFNASQFETEVMRILDEEIFFAYAERIACWRFDDVHRCSVQGH